MEVIEAQTLNFEPNFKFSLLIFFGDPRPSLVCATFPGSISNACKNVRGSTPNGRNVVSRKMYPGWSICTSITFFVYRPQFTTLFSPNVKGAVADQLLFRAIPAGMGGPPKQLIVKI